MLVQALDRFIIIIIIIIIITIIIIIIIIIILTWFNTCLVGVNGTLVFR